MLFVIYTVTHRKSTKLCRFVEVNCLNYKKKHRKFIYIQKKSPCAHKPQHDTLHNNHLKSYHNLRAYHVTKHISSTGT